jgi:hypothetical protein
MVQLIQPNLTVTGQVGYCLKYARQVFGVSAVYSTAWQGWLNAKYKHTDRNLPNASILCWFSYQTAGHVVVYVPGKGYYSSPYKTGQSYYVGTSIADIEAKYACKYVGWSEDINNVRVAQEVTMAGISDDVSRQIGWHFMGRNGYEGKPNALQSAQGDIMGKELSNAQISAFFLSPEAREWRDSRVPKIYAELDALRSTNANLNTQVTQLSKAVADANTKLTQANTQIIGLTQTVNEKQAEIDTLVDEVEALTKENTELKAIIASGGAGSGEDTEWLNKIGEALRWLITRLGVKK